MPRLLFTVLCWCSLLCLSACAGNGFNTKKMQFTDDLLSEIPLSPYYLPDPQNNQIYDSWQLQGIATSRQPFFGLLKPNNMMVDPLFDFINELGMQPTGDIESQELNEKVEGCQGYRDLEMSLNSDGGLEGKLVFREFADDCSLALEGAVPLQGKIDPGTGLVIIHFSPELAGSMEQRKFKISGNLDLQLNAYQGAKQKFTCQVELTIEELGGQKYRMRDMLFTWDETGEHSWFSMAGTIDFDQLGSVEVTTDGYLVSYTRNTEPFDGILIFTGADEQWLRLFFPKTTAPGFFRIDQSGPKKTMGSFFFANPIVKTLKKFGRE